MKGKLLLRSLAGGIDMLLIFFPSYMLLTVLGVDGVLFQFLPQLLFAVYNTVAVTSFEGKTIGKHFARMSVYTEEGGALYLGLREVGKLLYFLPHIGIIFIAASFLLVLLSERTLHDWLGGSRVLLDKERNKLKGSDLYEEQFL